MIIALAIVTLLMQDGSTASMAMFPPGGNFPAQFEFVCKQNLVQMEKNVRRMLNSKEVTTPENLQRILGVKILCNVTTAA